MIIIFLSKQGGEQVFLCICAADYIHLSFFSGQNDIVVAVVVMKATIGHRVGGNRKR